MKLKLVVKIGGSGYDLLYYDGMESVISNITLKLMELNSEYGIVVTVGGGPSMDVVKGFGVNEKYKDLMATNALKNNALYIKSLLESQGEIVDPENIGIINDDFLEKKIAITYHSPEDIPLRDSDTHSLAISNTLMINNLYFLKNTPGIFLRDPHNKSDESNEFVKIATIDDFLSGRISRIGSDGNDEHLIETSALLYYKQNTNLEKINIMDVNNPENIEYALGNIDVGSVIVRE